MSKHRRPPNTGCVYERPDGRVVCAWRENGHRLERTVRSWHDGTLLLCDVERLRAEGEPLSCAIRKALGQPTRKPAADAVTFHRLIDLYLDARKPREASRYRQLQRESWADLEPGELSVTALNAWALGLLNAGKSGGTVRNRLNTASGVFRWGQTMQLVDVQALNVFHLARASIGTVTRKDRPALNADELAALAREVEGSHPEFFCVFLALCTGWRLQEVCGLTWGDVSLTPEPGFLACPADREKTRRAKRAAMPPQLRAVLLAMLEGGPRVGLVFLRPAYRAAPAGKWTSGPVVRRLREALAACVERGEVAADKLEGDDRTLPFDAHALRHSVRSILHAEGHDAVTVGAALGHEGADSKRRYTHALDGGLARLAADMGRVLAGPDKRKAAEA
ncbi:MAG: tyrosine-type recombinase/integrase [Planctomycetota bacterium]|jgi:integrase